MKEDDKKAKKGRIKNIENGKEEFSSLLFVW